MSFGSWTEGTVRTRYVYRIEMLDGSVRTEVRFNSHAFPSTVGVAQITWIQDQEFTQRRTDGTRYVGYAAGGESR